MEEIREDLRAELDPSVNINIPAPEPPHHNTKERIPPICLFPKRRKPEGLSALGVSVLSVRGQVANTAEDFTDFRLDSCADVMLISEAFYESLKFKPKLRQGMRMKLYGLTESGTQMRGYIHLPIFMTTSTGVTIETEAEAYVMPKMSVPIFLGEDYQMAYKLSVFCNVESGSRIRFGETSFDILVVAVSRSNDASKIRKSAFTVDSFIRAKSHRRDKTKRHHQKLRQQAAARII